MDEADAASSLGGEVVRHLADRYGSDARAVLAIAESDPDLAAPLVPGLPYLRAEAVFGVRHEMARTLDDVLSRRTRARLLGRDDSAAAARSVAELIAGDLGWDQAEIERQIAHYNQLVDEERNVPQLPEVALDVALGR
jgi:glycerol-3-phosphate dehydrogenase